MGTPSIEREACADGGDMMVTVKARLWRRACHNWQVGFLSETLSLYPCPSRVYKLLILRPHEELNIYPTYSQFTAGVPQTSVSAIRNRSLIVHADA